MAAACVGSGRVGWVEFTEEPSGGDTESQTDAGSSMDPHPAPSPSSTHWVLFEENTAHTQLQGNRHSICSTASFWSAAPPSDGSWNCTQSEHSSVSQSEHSSVSMGASTGDLPSLNAEELTNEDAALPQTPNSSVFTEDEGGDMMDAVGWTSTGSQSEASRSTWVTFDDDEDDVRKVTRSVPRPGRSSSSSSSHGRLDGQLLQQRQDAKSSNLIGPPPPVLLLLPHPTASKRNKTHSSGAERHLLDLTPEDNGACGPPGGTGGPVYTKKNPFLDAEFSDIQPSAINPFSSYFEAPPPPREEDRKWCPALLQSNGAPQGCGPGTFGFFESSADKESQDVHQHSNGDGTGGTLGETFGGTSGETLGGSLGGTDKAVVRGGPPCDTLVLDQMRALHIADPDQPGSPALPDDPSLEEEQGLDDGTEVLDDPYQPEHMNPREGWPMLLRIPEKKNIMSSRHWGPIYVRLSSEGDRADILLFYEQGLDKPFRTLRLDPRHQVSEHRLQSYEESGPVHSVSVDLVQYRERRRGIQAKSPVTHQPIREQLVKLATSSYADYLSFRHALSELLRRLPCDAAGDWSPPTPLAPTSGGVASAEEEVQVEVRDDFVGTVSEGDGRVVDQLVVTRVHVLAFLSGFPRCILGLNDVKVRGKEAVSRHDIIPTATPQRWLRLHDVELNEDHANELDFLSTRCVAFTPPARPRRFELIRFRTAFPERTPPFTLRTVAAIAGAEVTVQSWLLMSQGFSTNRDPLNLVPCENVAVRYPIPENWTKVFRREGSMGGERSLKARFNKGASFGSAGASGAEPAMRVTMGTAKYEPAFKAVVWRIARLPDKNSALAHPHTFFCRLELGSDQEVPATLERHLEVEFDMPAATASGAAVRSLSVGDGQDVKRWITYTSHYFYKVPIEQKRDGTTANSLNADQPNECAQQ